MLLGYLGTLFWSPMEILKLMSGVITHNQSTCWLSFLSSLRVNMVFHSSEDTNSKVQVHNKTTVGVTTECHLTSVPLDVLTISSEWNLGIGAPLMINTVSSYLKKGFVYFKRRLFIFNSMRMLTSGLLEYVQAICNVLLEWSFQSQIRFALAMSTLPGSARAEPGFT